MSLLEILGTQFLNPGYDPVLMECHGNDIEMQLLNYLVLKFPENAQKMYWYPLDITGLDIQMTANTLLGKNQWSNPSSLHFRLSSFFIPIGGGGGGGGGALQQYMNSYICNLFSL